MKTLQIEAPVNPNYCATVVGLKQFVDLDNCDNVKSALIFGNSVIVSKSSQEGDLGLFFPVEVQLSPEFLGQNNLFRKAEWGNAKADEKGFFEQHGRVKAVKFRGHKSEGFFIPLSSLSYLSGLPLLTVGASFDKFGEHEICRKYVVKTGHKGASTKQARQPRLEDSIVDNQFRFHFDTENLRRNVYKIQPNDYISITDKWHGTSVVIGKVLTRRNLNFIERAARKLGIRVQDSAYGLVYSSRRVIKAVNGQEKAANHYYSEDIWGIVAREVEDKIPNGFTLYGEIVGYTPEGSPIQTGYHYGCEVGGHKFLVYRVTLTTLDGQVVELAWPQMKEFCVKYGVDHVKEMYYGKAQNISENMPPQEQHWHENFLARLQQQYSRDQDCPYNEDMPAEGVVLRVDRLNDCAAYKLKNFRFLEHESKMLDRGTVDIETEEVVA